MRHSLLLAFLILALPALGLADQNSTGDLPRFEVASIREVDTQHGGIRMTGTDVYPGGRVVMRNLSLKALVQAAFGVAYWQISGGEDWMDKTTFDVEAKSPEGIQPPLRLGHTWYTLEDERLRQMLQALLTERFHLKFHTETAAGTAYTLEKVDKSTRLSPTNLPDSIDPSRAGFCSIGRAAATWVIFNCTVQQIADFANSYVLHRLVLDKTGLEGHFDFRYQIIQTDPSVLPNNDSSFLDAIEAMGLKLKKTTGPVETFVIDHAENPSPN